MSKADPNHNYYADLDLPSSATVDEVKKAYRKLALQYHPDRNAGHEAECIPRFQAIQTAQEILGDPSTKARYDADRRRAGVSGLFTKPPTASSSNNPTYSWAPPPRRTADPTAESKRHNRPGREGNNANGAANGANTNQRTGADRFTNFPRPNPPPRKDPAAERAHQFRAWQNMSNADRPRNTHTPEPRPPPPNPPREAAPGTAPTRPRPQRTNTRPPPTEDEIRAGMRHGGGPPTNGKPFTTDSAEAKQSAWQAFQSTTGTDRPGIGRRKTRQTPKKAGGFDPYAPGDERPAPTTANSYAHRRNSEDLGRMFNGAVPPPPPGPPPATTPESPLSPNERYSRPMGDPLRPFKSRTMDEDAFNADPGGRRPSPYPSRSGERTNVGLDGLRRSGSTRDTTRLQPDGLGSSPRARSNSPASRTQQVNIDSGSDEPELTHSPGEYDPAQASPKSSAPQDRPIKKPVPRSGRYAGMSASDTAAPSEDEGNGRDRSQNIFNLADNGQTFTPQGSRNRSAGSINTNFSPEPFSGHFTGANDYFSGAGIGRKGSPAGRGAARQRSNLRSNTADTETTSNTFTMPPPPPRPFGSDGTSKATREASFTASDWHEHFQDNSWAQPTQGASKEQSTSQTHGVSENKQHAADQTARPPPDPTSTTHEQAHTQDSKATYAVYDDEMDLDSSPANGTRTSTPAAQTNKEPRLYSVPQSNWHHTQQSTHQPDPTTLPPPPPRPNAQRTPSTNLKTDLRDFTTVEPLGPATTAAGLSGMADLASSLPFQSQPSTQPPNTPRKPQKLSIPPKPKAPETPQTLNKATWQVHVAVFARYVKAFHAWNHQMLEHFNQREKVSEQRIASGMSWLEAAGELAGGGGGFWSYMREVKEDEQVRDAWNVAWDKHGAALEEFERVRGRVRELALAGRLGEH